MKRWPTKSLGELVSLEYGRALRTSGRSGSGRFPVYGSNGVVGSHDQAVTEEPTIVLGRKGAIGEAHLVPNGCWPIDTAFYTQLKHPGAISLRYLLYWFRSADLKSLAITATIPGLNRRTLYMQLVPVPPLPEQERIVKLLDEADELRKLRTQADRRTADLIPALFHEMFGDPATNPKGWPVKSLGNVLEISRERIEPTSCSGTLFNYIGLEHIERNTGTLLPHKPMAGAVIRSTKNVFHPGDILYGKLRPYLNKVHLAAHEGICSTEICVLRALHGKVHPSFATSYLRLPHVLHAATGAMAGANLPRIAPESLLSIPIAVPPFSLQTEFAEGVSEIDALTTVQATGRMRLDALFQSVLHCAFKGEV